MSTSNLQFNVNKSVSENSSNEIKKTTGALIIEDWVSDCDEDESEEMVSDNVQHKSEPKPEQTKQPRKISENLRNNKTNWNEKKTQKLGVRISIIDCLLSSEVGDEAFHKKLGDRMERAATTASSLEAKQDSDAQTRFEAASKSPMIHLSQELTHLDVGRTV
ncbi:hypothetical protein Tco_1255446 [Tanacetum coccineum]